MISSDSAFLSSLRHIGRRLEPFKKTHNITVKLTNLSGRHQLCVAYNSLKNGQAARERAGVASALVDAIADVVVADCKYYYIESSLRLPIDDEISRHAFIRALSNFDRTQDHCIAKSLIKLTPHFLLDSFYMFSLDILKTRWQEVCTLANENACFLVCDGTFRELLRFLISNLECRCPEVHLIERGGEVEVLAGDLKPINVYVNDELSGGSQVISTLISIAPKRIFVHQDANPNPIFDYVRELFRGCVQVEKR